MKVLVFIIWGTPLFAQDISLARYAELRTIYDRPNDTTYVVNFWATWCSPCIDELPYFEEARSTFEKQKVRILLVSVDFKSQFEKKVKPFVYQHKLKSTVILLDEPDANSYIDRVHPRWSGAIPATLIVNRARGVNIFKEEIFTKNELMSTIRSTLK